MQKYFYLDIKYPGIIMNRQKFLRILFALSIVLTVVLALVSLSRI